MHENVDAEVPGCWADRWREHRPGLQPARRSLKPGLLDGLAFSAHDTGWSYGTGAEVIGSASALIATIAGRAATTDELTGDGAAQIRRRALPAPPQTGEPTAP
jgi:hypothetical protein